MFDTSKAFAYLDKQDPRLCPYTVEFQHSEEEILSRRLRAVESVLACLNDLQDNILRKKARGIVNVIQERRQRLKKKDVIAMRTHTHE